MKSVSDALKAHLAGEMTTLAHLVRIVRKDGETIGMTDHDHDLFYDGVLYRADGAFTAEKMTQSVKLNAKGMSIVGMLESERITQDDLVAGLYDHARVDFFLCNWADLSQGIVHLRRGWIGKVEISGAAFSAVLTPFLDLINRSVGQTYTPECRYCLGDNACGVDVNAFTFTGTVSAVKDRYAFYDSSMTQESGAFDEGALTWLSGKNAGRVCEVMAWDLDAQSMRLWLPLPHVPEVGDAYSVVRGCDKKYATCRSVFGNGVNYGGFPYLPGIGKILDYPS